MANLRTFQRSFGGGEISPEMFGRIDDTKYSAGLATCRNFITLPQGPAENRSGSYFVRAKKDSTNKSRLIPFTFSTTQTMVLEFGDQYIRFYTQGAWLTYAAPAAYNPAATYYRGDLCENGGTNYYCIFDGTTGAFNVARWYALPADMTYEIPTNYLEADLFDLHYVQSADVMTITHNNYPPRELRRNGATDWTLTLINFGSPLGSPAPPFVVKFGTGTGYNYSYVVTAIAADLVSESTGSGARTIANSNLYTSGTYHVISWVAVAGAASTIFTGSRAASGRTSGRRHSRASWTTISRRTHLCARRPMMRYSWALGTIPRQLAITNRGDALPEQTTRRKVCG